MYRHNKLERTISHLLVFALVTSMLGFTPAFAAASSNPTVEAAVSEKTSGITDPNTIYTLDLSECDMVGELYVSELKAEFPNLLYLNVNGSNITNVVETPGVTTDRYDTIASGDRMMTAADVSVPNYSKTARTPIDLDAICGEFRFKTADGTEGPLPDGLIQKISWSVDDGREYSGTGSMGNLGTVSPDDASIGPHSLSMEFQYAYSGLSVKFTMNFAVLDTRLILASETNTIYQGASAIWTLTKYGEDGSIVPAGDPSDYSVSTTTAGVMSAVTAEDGKLKIMLTVDSTADLGSCDLEVTENSTGKSATAAFEIEALPAINNISLYEYNYGATSSAPVGSADTIYIKGGTSVSSTNLENAGKNYTSSTFYILYNADTEAPLDAAYKSLITTSGTARVNIEATEVDGHAAIRVSAPPVSGLETEQVTVELSGSTASAALHCSVLTSRPLSYSIYKIPASSDPTFTVSSKEELESLIANGDDSVDKVSQYDWNENEGSFVKNDSESNGLTLIEDSECRVVVVAVYDHNGDVFVVDALSITKWYDGTDPSSNFGTAGTLTGANVEAQSGNGLGTVALALKVGSYSGADANAGMISVSISDGASTNNVYGEIRVAVRQINKYIITTRDKTLPVNGKLNSMWESDVTTLTPGDRTVASGTSASYQVFAAYDNGDVELADLDSAGISVASDNTPVMNAEGNGSRISVTAVDTYRANESAKITVEDADGKSGSIILKLGLPKVKGLTYVLETPEGIKQYQTGDELKTTLTASSGNALEIPRGLTGHIWVVPVFTDSALSARALSDYRQYAITTGLDTSSETASDSANPLGTVSVDRDSAYAINTSNVIEVDQYDLINLTFKTNGSSLISSDGTGAQSYELEGRTVSTVVPVKITAPIVTDVVPELYDSTSDTYVPIGSGGNYRLDGHVGQTLKLRIKVIYSDGIAVDALGGNHGGVYSSGVYFANDSDTIGNYDFTRGPTIPSAFGFAGGNSAEMSVLYGYFMSAYPKAYKNVVNPTGGRVPDWNNNCTAEQIQDILETLTKQIKIHAYETGATEETAGVRTDWLTMMSNQEVLPGHYEIELKEAGTYELDFSGEIKGSAYNGEKNAVTGKIMLTVSAPVAEAVYLIGVNNSSDTNSAGCLTYSGGEYRFDNTPVPGGGYKTFRVYPVILDTTWWTHNRNAVALPAEIAPSSVGENTGIRYVTASDWSAFAGGWSDTSSGKFAVAEKTDAAGRLYLEVTVLDDLVSTADISLSLAARIQQSSTAEYQYSIPSPQPANPGPLKIKTTSADLVVDISVTPPQSTTISYGQDVAFEVGYLLQSSGNVRDLNPEEFPGEEGYHASNVNALVVTPGSGNPGACGVAKLGGSGSSLLFSPTTTGTYTFNLSTKNASGAQIPTAPAVRTITFTVTPAQLAAQTLYYGETVSIQDLVSGTETVTFSERGTALNPALLASGNLQMQENVSGNTTVQIWADGTTVAEVPVAIVACDKAVHLIPDTSGNPVVFANGDTQSLQWEITYSKPAPASGITLVEYENVDVDALIYIGGSADFLSMSAAGMVTATDPGTAGIPVLTGIYQVMYENSTPSIFRAQLNRDVAPAVTPRIYELRDSGNTVLSALSFTQWGEEKSVYLWDVTETGSAVQITKFNVSSDRSNVVIVENSGSGVAKITSVANGAATVTFTALQGTSTGTVTVPVEVNHAAAPSELAITAQPLDQTAVEGGSATFTVVATSDRLVAYQWQEGIGGTWSDIVGATSASYTISATTMGMNGRQYRCVVSDGAESLNSHAVTLTVTAAPSGALTITAQPVSQTVSAGSSATFTVTATSGNSITYQWSEKTSGSWTNISGANSASYTVRNVATGMNGNQYRCVVSDGATTINSGIAVLTVTSGGSSGGSGSGGSGSGGVPVGQYALSFQTNGGSSIDSIKKDKGTEIRLSGFATTRNGYEFDGWYADAALTERVTAVTLDKDITVYAKWKKTTASGTTAFNDVPSGSYYEEAVNWAVKNGVTSGTSATTFAPNGICTRAQTVTFLWRAMGAPEPGTSHNPFTDVSRDAYYYKAVLWAVEKGITQGTSETTFSPDDMVTRGQTVTFLWRAAGSVSGAKTNPFTDVERGAYYADAVLWAVDTGVTSGTSTTTFSPNNQCTRAQIVTLIWRYVEK